MNLILYLIIFIFGLIIGSFLNCMIYRLEINKGFLWGRSFCPHCKHELFWKDLIPVLSFFILGKKCRYCREIISWQYPLVELFTGLIFVLIIAFMAPMAFTASVAFMALWLFSIASLLIIIFVYDLKHYLIPDKVIYSAIVITFIYNSIFNWFYGSMTLWLYGFMAAFIASGFFLLIFLVSKGKWIGFGDVNLGFLMGFLLGWPNVLVALFGGFFIGAIIGVGQIFLGKKTLKSQIPFGPFLITGTFIALFWGEKIIQWYMSHLNI
ncbi:MAG TPA: prepilin peptidase [bacterium]|nr:prepilin peptidase [bacterium]